MTCNQCNELFVFPVLELSGPHFKAICPLCSSYIKFISKEDLPTLSALRLLIWHYGQQDKRFIDSCKNLCKFQITDGMTDREIYVQHANLFVIELTMLQRANNWSSQVSL